MHHLRWFVARSALRPRSRRRPLAQGTTLAAAQEDIASDLMRVATMADAQVVASGPLDIFTVEETDEESDSSTINEEATTPYAAGSAGHAESQRRLGTIVGLPMAPAPPQSLLAAARRRAEPDAIDLEAAGAPWT